MAFFAFLVIVAFARGVYALGVDSVRISLWLRRRRSRSADGLDV